MFVHANSPVHSPSARIGEPSAGVTPAGAVTLDALTWLGDGQEPSVLYTGSLPDDGAPELVSDFLRSARGERGMTQLRMDLSALATMLSAYPAAVCKLDAWRSMLEAPALQGDLGQQALLLGSGKRSVESLLRLWQTLDRAHQSRVAGPLVDALIQGDRYATGGLGQALTYLCCSMDTLVVQAHGARERLQVQRLEAAAPEPAMCLSLSRVLGLVPNESSLSGPWSMMPADRLARVATIVAEAGSPRAVAQALATRAWAAIVQRTQDRLGLPWQQVNPDDPAHAKALRWACKGGQMVDASAAEAPNENPRRAAALSSDRDAAMLHWLPIHPEMLRAPGGATPGARLHQDASVLNDVILNVLALRGFWSPAGLTGEASRPQAGGLRD